MPPSRIEELTKDVEELNKLASIATRSKVRDVLLIETRKIETEIIRLRELETDAGKAATKASVPSSNPTKCYDVKLTNYAWDQSDKFVKIYVDLNGVHDIPCDNVRCEFISKEMKLIVSELNNRNYVLSIKGLSEPIDPESSHWKVKKDKVVVFMQKEKQNRNWKSLTGGEMAPKKMNDLDPRADQSEGLMSMMKQLYESGDDEMKRSIAKAWTEGQAKQQGF